MLRTALLLLLLPVAARACEADGALTAELARREATDQQRLQAWRAGQEHGRESPEAKTLWARQETIDGENVAWLRAQVARSGWPQRCAVGEAGSKTAFLIAQHGDLKTRQALRDALADAVAAGEAQASHLAYLDDRNLVEAGKPQRYGTQWKPDGTLYPVDDPDGLAARRTAVGLGPVDDYKPL